MEVKCIGAFGCLLLILKKSLDIYLFTISLLGVVVTMIHTLGLGIDFGIGEIIVCNDNKDST